MADLSDYRLDNGERVRECEGQPYVVVFAGLAGEESGEWPKGSTSRTASAMRKLKLEDEQRRRPAA